VFRISAEDFEAGRLPEPFVTGLGILDGSTVSRRGTVLVSNPRTREIHAFTAAGDHLLLTADDGAALPVATPADINVVYPKALGGEPALLVADLAMGSAPGEAQILALDITGL
jgi:hypothetical protein